jgi:hypothetical protein
LIIHDYRVYKIKFRAANAKLVFIFAVIKLLKNMGMICNILRVSPDELEAYLADSSLLEARINSDTQDPNLYDIDKSWDGIIYLLTGSNSSDTTQFLSRIIFSGQLIDKKQKLGSGPAHYLLPQQVKDLNDHIRGIEPSSLKDKFDATAMKELGVYPNVWDHDDTADYLIEYFETIQEIYALASQNGEAIITFIV